MNNNIEPNLDRHYLEGRYGPVMAQAILDEMQRTERLERARAIRGVGACYAS